MSEQTIAAIATAPGTAGIGIVRMSGPMAFSIANRIFKSYTGRAIETLAGFSGTLGRIYGEDGAIDEAIAFVYHAPKSYTGEDVVEFSCHGGIWVVQSVLRLCISQGAQPAGPGEFTKRAFLNGKMDLIQAESVMDIIRSQGDAALRASLSAHSGGLNRKIDALADSLTQIAAQLAAWSDYPEEDMEDVTVPELLDELLPIHSECSRLLSTYDQGRILFEGIRTAIVGRPNVGKSTLMNLLTGFDRSIVSSLPGTTRDVVEDSVRLGDIVLRLSDTAGIRDTEDQIEQVGVKKARDAMETADLVLAVFDSSQELTKEDRELAGSVSGKPCVVVCNKMDLPSRLDREMLCNLTGGTPVEISAATGDGKGALEKAVMRVLKMDHADPSAAILTNERQRSCLDQAFRSIGNALDSLTGGITLDAVTIDIEDALGALLSLTGRRVTDTVVDEVFSRFCVGK